MLTTSISLRGSLKDSDTFIHDLLTPVSPTHTNTAAAATTIMIVKIMVLSSIVVTTIIIKIIMIIRIEEETSE